MDQTRRRCAAITSGGKPCPIAPPTGRAYCVHHDPERVEESRAARQRGGLGKARTARSRKLATFGIQTLADLEQELMLAVCQVRYGIDPKDPKSPKLDIQIARVMASMVGVLRHVAVATEYERQINELREMIASLMADKDRDGADDLQTA